MNQLHSDKIEMIAIFGMMRTGSNLLERILSQHPKISIFGELFNNNFVGRPNWSEYRGINTQNRAERYDDLLTFVKNSAKPNLPVFRIFEDHEQSAIDKIVRDPTILKVVLKRSFFDSFVSLKQAELTDQWRLARSEKSLFAKVEFAIDEFQDFSKRANKFYSETLSVLDETQQKFLKIDYQEVKSLEALNKIISTANLDPPFKYFFVSTDKQQGGNKKTQILNPQVLLALSSDRECEKHTDVSNETHAPAIEKAYIFDTLDIAYLPVPHTGEKEIVQRVASRFSVEPKRVDIPDLKEWQSSSAERKIVSWVIHPAKRAYLAMFAQFFENRDHFQGKFLHIVNESLGGVAKYPVISKNIENQLPIENWEIAQVRKCFKLFCRVLRNELWVFTNAINSPECWPQALLIENMRSHLDVTVWVEGAGQKEVATKIHSNEIYSAMNVDSLKVSEPFDANRFIYNNTAHVLYECFREDYDQFLFDSVPKY